MTSVAFSPDGTALASGSDDTTVRLWAVGTGDLKATLAEHTDGIKAITFSPDGTTLASASQDMTMRVWDIGTGKLRETLTGYTKGVECVAFSSDGKLLAIGRGGETLQLWDTASWTHSRTLTGHTDGIKRIAFSPDGTMYATTGRSGDGAVQLWDMMTGKRIRTLASQTSRIDSVAFSPDGKVLVTGSADGKVQLWDTGTWEPKQTLDGYAGGGSAEKVAHFLEVTGLTFSADGKVLASASRDGAAQLWDAVTWKQRRIISMRLVYRAVDVALSPDGTTLVSVSGERNAKGVYLWDPRFGFRVKMTFAGHRDAVTSVAYNPVIGVLATGSSDGTVLLWKIADLR